MCLIVDANCAAVTFCNQQDGNSAPIIKWLLERDGCVVYGGRLAIELLQLGRVAKFLAELKRAARAIALEDSVINAEETVVAELKQLRSDDPHVIALARVSGARTLRTEDQALMNDFKDVSLVPRPQGRIYRNASHARLLCHCAGCPRYNA
jgi:hypothetical protein